MRELRQVGLHRASRVCAVDEQVHCSPHLRRTDQSERLVCVGHKAGCALEGVVTVFASDEVDECPVCGKRVCAVHRAACAHCGRQVCTADLEQRSGRCGTCAQLAATREPPAEVVTAARAAAGGKPRAARAWQWPATSHLVVEVDLEKAQAEGGVHAAAEDTVRRAW
jgi:hypothetical protein